MAAIKAQPKIYRGNTCCKVISLVNDLRAKNQAREKSGEEPSIEGILYSPERQKLAAYLLNLSVAARTELIALMLLGRGDEFKSYSTALAHSLKYKKDAGGQVLYIFGKTMRLAKYLTDGLEAARQR